MDISICSYSFHRLLRDGKQDVFKYISDCAELGCTSLDLWNGHLPSLHDDPARPLDSYTLESAKLTPAEGDYLAEIKAAADQANLPFGCLAIDGTYIYEDSPEARQANRIKAYRWLNIAERLGAQQVRIDSGGRPEMPDEMLAIIVAGYNDLLPRASAKGIEVVIENHWGASNIPENVVRILDSVEGLGLLFDSANWAEGTREQGWKLCPPYARATHIKTYEFDAEGNETTMDIPRVIGYLRAAGYNGSWGIESTPQDGDEYEGARKTIALIQRVLAEV